MKLIKIIFWASILLFFSGAANSTVLDFEDFAVLNSSVGIVPYDEYHGFNLRELNADIAYNMAYMDVSKNINPSGYYNGVVSGDYVIWIGTNGGFPAWISRSQQFDFTGAFVTSPWMNEEDLVVKGFLNGEELYSENFIINATEPLWVELNFLNIDSVSFYASGGVDAGYIATGHGVVIDDFTFNEPAPVPEPATILLLGFGLLGLARVSRKD